MTIWVIYQDTDFCQTLWEERFYNAIVGVIYCFCFFNLKEGRSRYRAAIFYSIIITENLAFLGVYYWVTEKEWMGIGAVGIVLLGTALGMTSMLLYYGYFHPGGKIRMCVERESYDFEKSETASSSPDFVIHDNSKYATPFKKINSLSPSSLSGKPSDKPKIQHSRSFKRPCPPKRRFSPERTMPMMQTPHGTTSPTLPTALTPVKPCSFSPNNETYMSIEKSTPMAASTVLEDNNESIESSTTYMAIRSSSSQGNQPEKNDTYMSLNSPILINSSQEDSTISNESLITVINRKNTLLARSHQAAKANIANSEKVLLKRSPVVKDITSGYAQISPIDKVVSQQKKRDFTIIVPPFPRLRRTEPLDPPKLPPK
ncbi:XK-related protein, partial [Caligus rogercresseyi]